MNIEELIKGHLVQWGVRAEPLESRSARACETAVEIPTRGQPWLIPLEIRAGKRTEITPPEWEDLKRTHPNGLIIGHDYVNQRQAARYRVLGIPYVDAAGNAWLDFDGFKVWVEGRRPAPTSGRAAPLPRAFAKAGAKLVFVLLVRDELVGAPMRQLAHAATISLGATQKAIKDLDHRGYLDIGGGRTGIRRREDLVTEWVGAFVNRLLPSLEVRYATGPTPDSWPTLLKPGTVDATIAGEANQPKLLRPTTTTMYGAPPWAEVTQIGRLRPADGDANVILRERFWNEEVLRFGPEAPVLLDYAELIASGDARQREAAAQLREAQHV